MILLFNVTLLNNEIEINLSAFKIVINKLCHKLPIDGVKIVINSRHSELKIIQDSELGKNEIFKGVVQNEDVLKTVSESGHETLIIHISSDKNVSWETKISTINRTDGLIESFNLADLRGNWIISINKERGHMSDKNNGVFKTILDVLNQIRIQREYILQTTIPFKNFKGLVPEDKKIVNLATFEIHNKKNTAHNIRDFLFKSKNKSAENFDVVTNWKNKSQFFERTFIGHLMLCFVCFLSITRFVVIFLRTVYTKNIIQFMIVVFDVKIYKIFLVFYMLYRLFKVRWLYNGYSRKVMVFGYLMSIIIQLADPYLLGEHLFMIVLNIIF